MRLDSLFGLLLQIALMLGLGFFLYRRGLIKDDFKKALSDFLLDVVLPISVLSSCQTPFSADRVSGMGITLVVSLLYYLLTLGAAHLIIRRVASGDVRIPVFMACVVFANVGFLGFPFAQSLLGSEGVLYAAIYNFSFNIFMFTYGKILLGGSKQISLREALLSPLNIASAVAIAVFLSPFRLPAPVADAFSSVGDMMVPLSMIIIGCNLSAFNPRRILLEPMYWAASAARLLLLPGLMLGVLWLCHLPYALATLLVLLTAMPSGSLNVIFAERYNHAPLQASGIVLHSMLCCAPTLALFAVLCTELLQ